MVNTERARTVSGGSLKQSDVEAWRHLLRQAFPYGNAFLSPAFVQAASAAYPRVFVCLIEDDQGIAAILPYQHQSAFAAQLGAAERVGEEMSDCFGLVTRENWCGTPETVLARAGLHHLYFTHLESRQLALGLTGEQPRHGLRIMLPGDGSHYWGNLERDDPKFARDTERRERRAAEELGPLRFHMSEADPSTWLPQILKEKRAQYLRTGKGDWLAMPERQKLLEEIAGAAEPDCTACVSTLFFGDTWAAMHFGLRSGSTLHYWFPVYNPALGRFAPGRLLLRQIILNAPAAGLKIIDRGLGESEAKRDFPSERQTFYSGVWYRPGARSLIFRSYQSAKWRLAAMSKTTKVAASGQKAASGGKGPYTASSPDDPS